MNHRTNLVAPPVQCKVPPAQPVIQGYPEFREVPLPRHHRDGTGYKDPKERLDGQGPKERRGVLGSREDGSSVFGTISMTRPTLGES